MTKCTAWSLGYVCRRNMSDCHVPVVTAYRSIFFVIVSFEIT